MNVICPECGTPVDVDVNGRLSSHRVPWNDSYLSPSPVCIRSRTLYRGVAGYVVLCGPGFPAMHDSAYPDEHNEIAWFATSDEAQQWIDDHPKAKSPVIRELRSATP